MKYSRFPGLILLILLIITSASRSSRSAEVEIAFLGDVMLGRGIAERHAGGDWSAVFAEIDPFIRSADLAVANLESPLTAVPLIRQTYDLRAPVESAAELQDSGLDLLSLANNHSMDAGLAGYADTTMTLQDQGLTAIGPSLNPVWVTRKGLRLAFLACEDVTHPMDVDKVVQSIQDVRRKADLVVLSIHWGMEYAPEPSPRERQLARDLIEAGVDLIVGHHPHILQQTEWIIPEDQDRTGFVAYSLGNALFDQPSPPSTRQSAVLVVRLGKNGVRAVDAVPFQIYFRDGVTKRASDTASEAIMRRLSLPVQP